MKHKNSIDGLIAAAFTPLDDDGNLNVHVIPDYLSFLKRNNVKGVFINGTSGEAFSLTTIERNKIVDAWVSAREKVGDKSDTFKLIVQVGATGIEDEKKMVEHVRGLSVDGFSSMAPIFFKPSKLDVLLKHIQKVAAVAPEIPYYYYHVPQISGVDFPMMHLLNSIQKPKYSIPNFAGIKFSLPNFYDYMSCQATYGEKYDMPFCSDQILICALTLGATGSIGSTYNYSAPLSNEVIRLFREGKIRESRNMEQKLNQLSAFLHDTGAYFSVAKMLIKSCGVDLGTVRSPLIDYRLIDDNKDDLIQSVDEYIEEIHAKEWLCK